MIRMPSHVIISPIYRNRLFRGKTPISSLKGLRVYRADRDSLPSEVQPPPSARNIGQGRVLPSGWLNNCKKDHCTIVGIDHGFSFPIRYFEVHHLLPDWPSFLDDFQHHWPTDGDHVYVDFIRDGLRGNGADRMGNTRWRRLTEERAGSAKSVFHFDVPGSVAKSTHSGIPWLRYLRQKLADKIHFWPFDGWESPRVVRSLRRFIHPYGAEALPAKTATRTSMTLIQWPDGCDKLILMAAYQHSWPRR